MPDEEEIVEEFESHGRHGAETAAITELCLAGVTLRRVTRDESVFEFILSMLAVVRVFLRSRGDTALEVLALRQQVAVLQRKRPRPVLNSLDRLFWTTLRRIWSRWSDTLVIVK